MGCNTILSCVFRSPARLQTTDVAPTYDEGTRAGRGDPRLDGPDDADDLRVPRAHRGTRSPRIARWRTAVGASSRRDGRRHGSPRRHGCRLELRGHGAPHSLVPQRARGAAGESKAGTLAVPGQAGLERASGLVPEPAEGSACRVLHHSSPSDRSRVSEVGEGASSPPLVPSDEPPMRTSGARIASVGVDRTGRPRRSDCARASARNRRPVAATRGRNEANAAAGTGRGVSDDPRGVACAGDSQLLLRKGDSVLDRGGQTDDRRNLPLPHPRSRLRGVGAS